MDVTSTPFFLQQFFVAVEILRQKALEEEMTGARKAVAQTGIHGVGGLVVHIGVQTDDPLALLTAVLFAEGHQLPGLALARQAG